MLCAKETRAMRSALTLACLLILCQAAAFAADPPPRAEKAIVTRRYDDAALQTNARPDDRPDPADRPLAPDDRIGLRTSTAAEQRASLVKLVRETIDPKSWRAAGGSFDIAVDGNELVVTQTAENHAAIASMLGQLKGDESDRAWHQFEAAVVPKLALRNAPLADALAEVSRAADLPVEVKWEKFRNAGLTPQAPVSLAAVRCRAPVALHAILRAAGVGPDAAIELRYTAKSVVVAPDPRSAKALRPNSCMINLQYLTARAAGLPAEPKPTRAAVIAAVLKRLAADFPTVTFRPPNPDDYPVVIVTATPSEYRGLRDRLYELEMAAAK
jgi:hypothetical protein